MQYAHRPHVRGLYTQHQPRRAVGRRTRRLEHAPYVLPANVPDAPPRPDVRHITVESRSGRELRQLPTTTPLFDQTPIQAA